MSGAFSEIEADAEVAAAYFHRLLDKSVEIQAATKLTSDYMAARMAMQKAKEVEMELEARRLDLPPT